MQKDKFNNMRNTTNQSAVSITQSRREYHDIQGYHNLPKVSSPSVNPLLKKQGMEIGHFTVVCLVTWPLSGSEAKGDLVLIQTLLLFICKCKLVSMRTTWFTCEKQEGLYQNKVTLASLPLKGQVTRHTTVKWPIDGWVTLKKRNGKVAKKTLDYKLQGLKKGAPC